DISGLCSAGVVPHLQENRLDERVPDDFLAVVLPGVEPDALDALGFQLLLDHAHDAGLAAPPAPEDADRQWSGCGAGDDLEEEIRRRPVPELVLGRRVVVQETHPRPLSSLTELTRPSSRVRRNAATSIGACRPSCRVCSPIL